MFKKIFFSLLLIGTIFTVSAQTKIRPYQEWNETAFVSVKTHQPANYVRPDNNWDILYTLRTPYTQDELNSMGIPCTESQLMLLEIGGLIEKEGDRWHTVIPILDKNQTDGLRAYIRDLQPYGVTDNKGNLLIPVIKNEENDFHRLMDSLKMTISMGLKNNVGTLLADYGIKDEKLGIVILYHEVMWDIIDLLIKEQGLAIPEIVKDGNADKTQLKNVSFFVEDGLFQ